MTLARTASGGRDQESASQRILRATAHVLRQSGAAKLSMQDVASAAGVSKGLIHYHFQDKDTLLVRVVDWITGELIGRERQALQRQSPQTVINSLWQWLDSELRYGHIQVLAELGYYQSGIVQQAVHASAVARRATAADTVESLFTILGLRPRVPVPLLADVTVAFVNGLVVQQMVLPEAEPRVAFDVFWLSLLSLVE